MESDFFGHEQRRCAVCVTALEPWTSYVHSQNFSFFYIYIDRLAKTHVQHVRNTNKIQQSTM